VKAFYKKLLQMTKYRSNCPLNDFSYILVESTKQYLHLEDDVRSHLGECVTMQFGWDRSMDNNVIL
jgi:hypothetical protein